jgi:hypothetical protein
MLQRFEKGDAKIALSIASIFGIDREMEERKIDGLRVKCR